MLMLSFRDMHWTPRRLLPLARTPSAAHAAAPRATERHDRTRQIVIVLAMVVAVVVLDQAAKWWAWRHVSWTTINSGGDLLVGPAIGAWYAAAGLPHKELFRGRSQPRSFGIKIMVF
jgi:hypothetical protein